MSAWAKIVDGKLTYPPPVYGNIVNPSLLPGWCEGQGFTLWEDAAITEQLSVEALPPEGPSAPDYTAVDVLCIDFRSICMELRAITGNEEFKGGYHEVKPLLEGPLGEDPRVLNLCGKLGWLNQYITYESNKCGLGQPGWWIRCWENV